MIHLFKSSHFFSVFFEFHDHSWADRSWRWHKKRAGYLTRWLYKGATFTESLFKRTMVFSSSERDSLFWRLIHFIRFNQPWYHLITVTNGLKIDLVRTCSFGEDFQLQRMQLVYLVRGSPKICSPETSCFSLCEPPLLEFQYSFLLFSSHIIFESNFLLLNFSFSHSFQCYSR